MERRGKGVEQSQEELTREIGIRDSVDSEREDSPLRRAEDAVLVDTTGMTVERQVEVVVRLVCLPHGSGAVRLCVSHPLMRPDRRLAAMLLEVVGFETDARRRMIVGCVTRVGRVGEVSANEPLAHETTGFGLPEGTREVVEARGVDGLARPTGRRAYGQ